MKREGRQHGMVRTYPIVSAPWHPRPKPRSLGGLSSPPTAGPFMKVSTKPTNHSKFTGKCIQPMCRDCHISPASKSKDKAKGAQRLRTSSDVVSDYGLITWRVVDARSGPKLSNFSATSVLEYLTVDDDCIDGYCEADYEECDDVDVEESNDYEISYSCLEIGEVVECDANKDGNEDEISYFSQSGDGDKDWCLV